MSRDWTLYLEDIADACRLIEEFTAGMSAKIPALSGAASRVLAEAGRSGTAGDAT